MVRRLALLHLASILSSHWDAQDAIKLPSHDCAPASHRLSIARKNSASRARTWVNDKPSSHIRVRVRCDDAIVRVLGLAITLEATHEEIEATPWASLMARRSTFSAARRGTGVSCESNARVASRRVRLSLS
jgi:hypothetical protein